MELTADNSNQSLLDHYNALGSVLDIHYFTIEQRDETDYHISLQAVVTAMRMIFKVRGGWPWKISADAPEDNAIYEGMMPEGQIISFADLLGPGYNLATGEVQLFTYYENGKGTSIEEGLTHALLNPPYGFKLMDTDEKYTIEYGHREQKRMTEFFNSFLNEALGIKDVNDTGHLVIYKWSDDWSSYFDEGKEWWGAFCWSVLDKETNKIIVIAASATD